jgi:hypothetical protein
MATFENDGDEGEDDGDDEDSMRMMTHSPPSFASNANGGCFLGSTTTTTPPCSFNRPSLSQNTTPAAAPPSLPQERDRPLFDHPCPPPVSRFPSLTSAGSEMGGAV